VSNAEREQTLSSIQQKDVQVVLTSDRDMAGEKYGPMRAYLSATFYPAARFGEVIILERIPAPMSYGAPPEGLLTHRVTIRREVNWP
ncbi:MAG TPA: hypothetical protein VI756_27300, partial [Blastocatellia bacterium]